MTEAIPRLCTRWLVLLAFSLAGLAWSEVHIFSLPDGRSIEAEIVSYDAKAGLVVLEREGGKRVKVSPSGFIEDDQRYIKDWIDSNAFLSDRILRVECDNRQVREWKEKETTSVTYTSGDTVDNFVHNVIKYEQSVYEFTFTNRGAVPIKGLVLRYCIYYEQSYMTKVDKPEMGLKVLCGSVDIPDIPGNDEITLSTEPVTIFEDDINPVPQLNGDQRLPGKGEIIGIRADLALKGRDKGTSREIIAPESLSSEKYPWTDVSVPNNRPNSFAW